MLAVARPRGRRTMGIDWNDDDMVELIDVLISNPTVISRYVNCSSNQEIAELINIDYPELEVSEKDIPKLIALVKDKYANGW